MIDGGQCASRSADYAKKRADYQMRGEAMNITGGLTRYSGEFENSVARGRRRLGIL
jgi:hypothetical protein